MSRQPAGASRSSPPPARRGALAEPVAHLVDRQHRVVERGPVRGDQRAVPLPGDDCLRDRVADALQLLARQLDLPATRSSDLLARAAPRYRCESVPPPARSPPDRSGRSSSRSMTSICTGSACQISLAYSRIVRSLEKRPLAATLRIERRVHSSLSRNTRATSRCFST